MKTLREYIAEIHIVESNLQHIAKTGRINGSLLLSLEDKFKEYAIEVAKQALKNASERDGCIFHENRKAIKYVAQELVLDESNIPPL